MLFTATTIDATGARRMIRREAASRTEAAAALRAEGFAVVAIEEAKSGADGFGGASTPFWHPSWLKPVTRFDIELGFSQLASMLKSGVSLLAALDTVAEQAGSPRAARMWCRVRDRVASGAPLSNALAETSRRFGGAVIALVRVGEQSGELDSSLLHASRQLESQRNLRSLTVNALAYPAFTILAALGVCIFLVVDVIPKIAEFLESGGTELPPMTQNLVDLSDCLTRHGQTVLIVLAAALAVFFALRAIPSVRLTLDAVALRIPVSGRIFRLAGTAVFSRAMGMLVGSGVTLLEALDVSAGLLGNRRLRQRVREARGAVMAGGALAPPLRPRGDFMPMLSQMVAVGETTGALAESFSEVAHFHETMLTIAIRRFSVTIEPVMIIVTGLIVGYVYVAFFMALFSMAGVS
jgi:type IV pilus assembly protein PilC